MDENKHGMPEAPAPKEGELPYETVNRSPVTTENMPTTGQEQKGDGKNWKWPFDKHPQPESGD